jgi:hypothetical protein
LGGDFEKVAESIGNSIKNRSKWSTKIKIMPTGEVKTHIGHRSLLFLLTVASYTTQLYLILQRCQNEELLHLASKLLDWVVEMDLLNQTNDNVLVTSYLGYFRT